jgi:phage terminase large subunit-like protein
MGRIAAELGMPFMPWQREVADVAMEIDPESGRLAYREVRVTVPRQSGKTSLMLALVLHRALGQANQQIRYTAQTGSDARKKWEDDWLPVLERSKFKPFYRVRKSNGHEALLFRSGSLQGLMATAEESGHGGSLDLAIADESFAHKDARIEQAVKPAMSTRPEPQFWLPSTAGTPAGSPYLYPKVLSGRKIAERQMEDESQRHGVCYVEFSAPDDADPYDPQVWWDCMPALGYTQTEQTIAADLQSMIDDPKKGLSEFRRAYLNQWVESMTDPLVPMDFWLGLTVEDASRPEWVVLGFDVGPHDSAASIMAVGEVDGDLASRLLETGTGTDWLLPALESQVSKWDRPYVVVDQKACEHLLPELERIVGFDRLVVRKASEVPGACAFWLRLTRQSRLRHRVEPELRSALAGAGQRPLGDGWAWSRTKSDTDITPLVAQTLAASFWLGPWGGEED